MVYNHLLRDKKYLLMFIVYSTVLVVFSVFSYKVIFHDTWEYITIAKTLAGFLKQYLTISHSVVYPWIISLFARYLPSFFTIKLVNVAWIILIGLLLYCSGSKKIAFLIWAFSPIAWMYAVMITPFVPASFFLLLAYLSIKKWKENNKIFYLFISALSLGMASALHTLLLILAVMFILSFFYSSKFKEVLVFLLFFLISFSLTLILDASLFSLVVGNKQMPFPIYTLVRFLAARMVIQLGLHSEATFASPLYLYLKGVLYTLFVVSPLLFYFYKVDYKKNKDTIAFLLLSFPVMLIQSAGCYLYSILLAPIAIDLLSNIFKKRDLAIHILASSFIILILVSPYLAPNMKELEKRRIVLNDLKMITQEFSFDSVVFDTDTLALFYFWEKNQPFIIPPAAYFKIVKGDNYTTQYKFELTSSELSPLILELQAGMRLNIREDINYETVPWILEKGEKPLEGYRLTKCYELLCVYQKEHTVPTV